MKINLKFIILLLFFVFLQIIWYNHLKLYGRFVPIFYIYPFLILSFSQNNLQLLIAFFSGLLLDIFLQTGGVFTAATVFIVYFRKLIIIPFLNNRRNEDNINPLQFTFNNKILYYGLSILLSILLINFLESLSFSYVLHKVPLFIINTLLSLIIIIFIDYLFFNKAE